MSKQNPIRAHTATNFRYFSDRLLGLAFYKVRLRRADVYRIWPTRWMGAEGKARLEPPAPSAKEPRSAPTTKRRVQAERQLEPPPTELTPPQTPQLPELPATKPEGIYDLAWDAVRAVGELRRQGLWPRKGQVKQLDALNRYLKKNGKDTVSLSTMKNALRWLRENGFN